MSDIQLPKQPGVMTVFFIRTFDAISTLVALILLSPLFLVLAVAIKMFSPGPVLFKQVRIGKSRRSFQMIKFRTMVDKADRIGSQVTSYGDVRITKIGHFLRRTKLDELPELWNVLIGDMSLVGPRPEVAKYVTHYKPEWNEVFTVRPGITDLATLQFRDEEKVLSKAEDTEKVYIDIILPLKIELALEYIRNRSIYLYLQILLLTIWSITLGRFIAKPRQRFVDIAEAALRKHNQNSGQPIE